MQYNFPEGEAPALSPRAELTDSAVSPAWPGTSPSLPLRQQFRHLGTLCSARTSSQRLPPEARASSSWSRSPPEEGRRAPSTRPPSLGLTFFSRAHWTGEPKARASLDHLCVLEEVRELDQGVRPTAVGSG